MDSKPYTYNYALHTDGVVKERVPRNRDEQSTVEFRNPAATGADTLKGTETFMLDEQGSVGKVDGEESSSGTFPVFVRTDGKHTDDFDSDRGVKTSATL
jgi:hypothetical protein